ncbi:hypothetical protein MJO29_012197 [Puccinia striiformis f. sp. tritici]|nr:hypothetical protein MJO29_012197 [Puccinia striiformis f. sp. tritici]
MFGDQKTKLSPQNKVDQFLTIFATPNFVHHRPEDSVMHSFGKALLLALCLNLTSARKFHHVRDVCDVEDSDAAYDACGMKKAFAGSKVYPELLSTYSPKAALHVRYDNVIVGGAQQLAPDRVSFKPSLSMMFIQGPTTSAGAQMLSKKFAVLGIDFQPQGRITKLFWLQSAMAVDPKTDSMTSSVPPIIPYKSPNPQVGTHEYVILVFEEAGAGLAAFLNENPKTKELLSGPFNLEDFLVESKLLNSLIAGSFFKSTTP